MDIENLSVIAEVALKLKHCDGVELIPYHAYGGTKAEQLGGKDNGNTSWIPSADDITAVVNYLTKTWGHDYLKLRFYSGVFRCLGVQKPKE